MKYLALALWALLALAMPAWAQDVKVATDNVSPLSIDWPSIVGIVVSIMTSLRALAEVLHKIALMTGSKSENDLYVKISAGLDWLAKILGWLGIGSMSFEKKDPPKDPPPK